MRDMGQTSALPNFPLEADFMNSKVSDNSFWSSSPRGEIPFAWLHGALSEWTSGKAQAEILNALLREMCSRLGWAAAVIVKQSGRDWISWAGRLVGDAIPHREIAEAMDRGELVQSGNIVVIPLSSISLTSISLSLGRHALGSLPSEPANLTRLVLVVDVGTSREDARSDAEGSGASFRSEKVPLERDSTPHRSPRFSRLAAIREAADFLSTFLTLTQTYQSLAGRARRFEAMLRIAASWSEFDECEKLLETIADSAAHLLGAERASIFLWDRKGKKLVGRPALGVEGNRLEVPDSQGIVGAVLQSGKAKRWHEQEDAEAEVNRNVDRTLQYRTRSLLAVPMWRQLSLDRSVGKISDDATVVGYQKAMPITKPTTSERQQAIGVFELINRKEGGFTIEDEEALSELAVLAASAIRNTQSRQRLIEDREHLVTEAASGVQVVGEHETIVAVRASAARVAKTDLSVLILGENGTGKEVLARSIHYGGPRRHHPFVAVNCAAIVESLLESELFGHEKGAFTDAQQTRAGKFELANRGTIFLDEIGDLSPAGQAKLLRVLEEKKVYRVGGSQMIDVDVRVIAATNQPLAQMVQAKQFREDLFFRLNTVTLRLPPLRERGADVEMLANYFLGQFAQQVGRRLPVFSSNSCAALRRYRWPGNIRELRNLVERVAYLCPDDVIEPEELGIEFAVNSHGDDRDFRDQASVDPAGLVEHDLAEATRLFQIQHIEHAISRCSGNMTDAATSLGLHRSNLYRKMRQLGMVDG